MPTKQKKFKPYQYDGLLQKKCNSIVSTQGLRLSSTNPLSYAWEVVYIYFGLTHRRYMSVSA